LSRDRQMLRDSYEDLKKYYYDQKYHGLELDARYKEFDSKMSSATSNGQCFGIIAAFLDGLSDSHVYFVPPRRPSRVEYGFQVLMVGDKALISQVRPGTDAEKKLRPGDQLLSWNQFPVDGNDALFKLHYFYNTLAPQTTVELALKDPSGQPRSAQINALIIAGKKTLDLTKGNNGIDWWELDRYEANLDHYLRQQYLEIGDVMVWKMLQFEMSDEKVDHMFGLASKHGTLILDLRGNPGGYTTTLERVAGHLFDHEIKIADRVSRKDHKPMTAPARGTHFNGKVIVLVDSESASAAELLARLVQLEHRGTVLGDRSSGKVMEARGYPHTQGTDSLVVYEFSITDADLIMEDGKSIEHTGVTPDELILPTAEDLAAGRDPVLARSFELAGLKMDPVAAGKLFPREWLPLQ